MMPTFKGVLAFTVLAAFAPEVAKALEPLGRSTIALLGTAGLLWLGLRVFARRSSDRRELERSESSGDPRRRPK